MVVEKGGSCLRARLDVPPLTMARMKRLEAGAAFSSGGALGGLELGC